jgi:hypothetical protein
MWRVAQFEVGSPVLSPVDEHLRGAAIFHGETQFTPLSGKASS